MVQEKYFLGRQPILDLDQKIVAYELLFRSADTLAANVTDHQHASSSVIMGALSQFGIEGVIGCHTGFFNLDRATLMGEVVELLPREQVVIELLETITADEEVVARVQGLKEAGFRVALDDNVFTDEYIPLYELADIVKIDILAVPPEELPAMVERFSPWGLTLLAEKVESAQQFQLCRSLGFQLFQGYFFARPVVLKQKRVEASSVMLGRLFNLISADADIHPIEELFKQNPDLAFNLLKLVNSVAMGLREKIQSVRHAVMVLGMRQLKRWVMLALYAHTDSRGVDSPLLELAVSRGRLMELLALKLDAGRRDGDLADSAFMTGMFSLADTLFEVPLANLVEQINLVDEVKGALLQRQGRLGSMLQLAELLEQNDFAAAAPLLEQMSLTLAGLNEAQFETINWVADLRAEA